MKPKSFFSFDPILFFSTVILMIIGVLFIYSSGISSSGVLVSSEYVSQVIWVSLGVILLFIVIFSDYSKLHSWSLYIYIFFILLLIITRIFGKEVNGARSWLGFFGFGIQPSEFAKIAVILFLGYFLVQNKTTVNTLPTFLLAFGIVLLPIVLILIQPDMGTALVFIPIFLIMIFIAGARKRHVCFVLLTGSLLLVFAVLPAWEKLIAGEDIPLLQILTNPSFFRFSLLILFVIAGIALISYLLLKKGYFYWILYFTSIIICSLGGSLGARLILKEYQIMRLIVFLDPGVDPKGTGWNIIQSITAVGSGGFMGKGYLKGTQSHYRFLPQQSTDFIFSIIAEEWGFIGSFVIILLFSIIIIRGLIILTSAKEHYAVYIGSGIIAMFLFHVIVNIGMAAGIMPITGIPLFFLSYGGSSLWTGLIGIGLILNIHLRRYR